MNGIGALLQRARGSAVAWTWVFSCVRLLLGLLLLPMVLRYLSREDAGMFYLFTSLVAMLPLIEATFSFNVGRQVTFAMGGAVRLLPQGTDPGATTGTPNFPLVRRLVDATGFVYNLLSGGVLLLLGTIGSSIILGQVAHTSDPRRTWIAWGLMVAGTVVELQSLRWLGFLRNMNHVTASAQLGTLAYASKAGLAAALLVAGGGLLSVPVAGMIASLLLWHLARRQCLARLASDRTRASRAEIRELLSVIWPNTWRAGLKLGSEYFANVTLMSICSHRFGLAMAGQYGLTLQLLGIAQQLAMVWTQVRWPLIGQLRAQKRLDAMRQALWSRAWLQNLTYLAGALGLIFLAQPLLRFAGSDTDPLPHPWFVLLALNHFLYLRFAFWVFLIATDNRLPSLWPTVATHLASVALAVTLAATTNLGVGTVVLAPLIAGSLFNYWYWMLRGARELGTTWWRFVRTPKAPSDR